jgi:hypothetical protein
VATGSILRVVVSWMEAHARMRSEARPANSWDGVFELQASKNALVLARDCMSRDGLGCCVDLSYY